MLVEERGVFPGTPQVIHSADSDLSQVEKGAYGGNFAFAERLPNGDFPQLLESLG
jgi:hypothetical protein